MLELLLRVGAYVVPVFEILGQASKNSSNSILGGESGINQEQG